MITVDFRRLDIKPRCRILDVGCGSGRHLGEAARFTDVEVVGVDRYASDVCDLNARMDYLSVRGEVRGRWSVATADITRLPFADDAFDLVICSEVLEHVPDDETAMRQLFRVVKPGGTVVVSVPRALPERICWRLSKAYRSAPGGHIRIYGRRELARKLSRVGARIVGFHFAHALHAPFWWLKCWVGLDCDDSPLVRAYHRFLVWDMMEKPGLTRMAERLLNPFVGKSLVVYCVRAG